MAQNAQKNAQTQSAMVNAEQAVLKATKRVSYLAIKAEYDGLTMAEEVEIATLESVFEWLSIPLVMPEIKGYNRATAGKRERTKRSEKTAK